MRRLLAGLLCLHLAGCVVFNYPFIDMHTAPPADFPQLKRSVKYLSVRSPEWFCNDPFGVSCSRINFHTMTCEKQINHLLGPEDRARALEHEDEHCNGRDHVGQSSIRDTWARFKAWARVDRAEAPQ